MKKILVLSMVVIMALGAFAGCGQQEQISDQSVQDQQVQSQEQMAAETQDESQEAQDQQDVIYEDGVAMNPADYDLISEDEAKQIALAKVEGAQPDDLRMIDLDYDDGRWVYEGEIYQGEWEYEFEINAENGNVIGWEKDRIYD